MKAPKTKKWNENIAAICSHFNRLHIARICGPESDVHMTRMEPPLGRFTRSASLLNNSHWRRLTGAYPFEPGEFTTTLFAMGGSEKRKKKSCTELRQSGLRQILTTRINISWDMLFFFSSHINVFMTFFFFFRDAQENTCSVRDAKPTVTQ